MTEDSSSSEPGSPSTSMTSGGSTSTDEGDRRTNVGAIVGPVVAIIIFIGSGTYAYVFLRRRRKRGRSIHIIFGTPEGSPTNEKKLDLVDDAMEFRQAKRRLGSEM